MAHGVSAPFDMASPPQKRPSQSSEEDLPDSKRQRTGTSAIAKLAPLSAGELPQPPTDLSAEERAREGLERSITVALDYVGFDGTSKEALEGFANLVETCEFDFVLITSPFTVEICSQLFLVLSDIQSFIEDVKRLASVSRRALPTPADFDKSLARFNLDVWALKHHLKTPVSRAKLQPSQPEAWSECRLYNEELPLVTQELSGKPEKEAKIYIPKGFPEFPSIHTYRYTPTDVAAVTAPGIGLRYDDGTPVVDKQDQPPADGIRVDPKMVREAAAAEAKQAEEALRGLVRASKINTLREIRAAASRNSSSKGRYEMWESAMRDLIEDSRKSGKGAAAPGTGAVDIADHSMVVNAERIFQRQEVKRVGKKARFAG